MAQSVELLPISGMETLQEGVKGATVEPVQLKPGRIEGRLAFAATEAGTLTFGQVTGDIRLRGPLSADTVTVGMLTQVTGKTTQWGAAMHCGDFGWFPPNVEHEAVYSAASSYLTIAVPRSDLERLGDRFGDPATRNFHSTGAMYRAPADVTAALLRRCQLAGEAMTAFPRLFSMPAARTAMVEELLDHFAAAFRGAGAMVKRGPEESRAPHALVRRAEDCLHDRSDIPIQLGHLCTELGVSERTLRRAFIDVVGLPPSTFMRNLRMSRVRLELLQADKSRHSVGDIAMQHGFWELGRFASQYRALFGEYPGETLSMPQA